jgi:hypothetical protein
MIAKWIGAAALAAAAGFAGTAQAVTFFQVDPNPSGLKLYLDSQKDAASSSGSVVTKDDVGIAAVGDADFANGFSSISPVKGGTLTDITFTPVDADAFSGFSFRGQDLDAGQTIDVIVQDAQGHAPETFAFTIGNANQDFSRMGIIASLAGETIKSVELVNSGGFKEAKQFEFISATGAPGIPEPASWSMLLVGFGAVGWAARRLRRGDRRRIA